MIKDILTAMIIAIAAAVVVPLIAAIVAISNVYDEMKKWL